jgi:large subunit ribosomal protein L1
MATKKNQDAAAKGKKGAPKLGKRLSAAKKAVDPLKLYPLADAISAIKSLPKTKFDETLDVAINLGVDAKNSDQNVRGTVVMPNGTGKQIRVAVFAKDQKAADAKKAGADLVGAEELVEQINKGQINFDRCIATPDMMGMVGKVAKVLGPKGLMPNPKLGTVTPDVATAVKNAKSGQVEFRIDKGGIIHAGVGKVSFSEKALEQNFRALIDAINHARPTGIKGIYLKKITLSSTMGPGLKVDVASL